MDAISELEEILLDFLIYRKGKRDNGCSPLLNAPKEDKKELNAVFSHVSEKLHPIIVKELSQNNLIDKTKAGQLVERVAAAAKPHLSAALSEFAPFFKAIEREHGLQGEDVLRAVVEFIVLVEMYATE
ncbi:hypothetical protein AGMMS49975_13210 [Clostridia bacterium]|nr:hypothetical protein AGMMS49975_13210 [Clostridia bacterium]